MLRSMTTHAQFLYAVWFAGLMAFCAGAFLIWLIWALFWDLYDHRMQQRNRRRLSRFDGARSTQRYAFLDKKGVTKP
jgi:hypothetical protein